MTDTQQATSPGDPFEIAIFLGMVAAKHDLPKPTSVTTSVGGACPLYAQMHFDDHGDAAAWQSIITGAHEPSVREPRPKRGEWMTCASGDVGEISVVAMCHTDMTPDEVVAATAEALLSS